MRAGLSPGDAAEIDVGALAAFSAASDSLDFDPERRVGDEVRVLVPIEAIKEF